MFAGIFYFGEKRYNIVMSKKMKIGAIVVSLIVFLFVLNLTALTKKVKNVFYFLSSPIQKTFWKIGDNVSDFFRIMTEMKNLKKENEELKLKIHELLAKNVQLKELKKENEVLKEALGIDLAKEFKLEMAQVVSKDISQDSILIDKGSNNGIKENMPVITAQKVLCGKINKVFERYSNVILVTNKKSSFNAKIQENNVNGVIKGKGAFKMSFELIPKEKEVFEGNIVITTQLGGIFPKDLLVGEITKVKKSDIEPFQQAEVKPFFNIKEIETLFIITDF